MIHAHQYATFVSPLLFLMLAGSRILQALPLIKRLLPPGCDSRAPVLLTIFFGANDASDAKLNPMQHVPLAEYKANLLAMVAHVRAACPSTRIVLVTPPPVVGERWAEACKAFGKLGPPDRSREVVSEYAEAVREAGFAMGDRSIVVVDLWKAKACIEPSDLSDGLHFGVGGNEKMFNSLQACIKHHFGDALNADDG
eukprot:SAG31_NODE_9863_length_1219_cov_1.430357_2_plen_196_part_01